MDFRRDDEQKHANEEQFHEEAQTPQTAGSEEQRVRTAGKGARADFKEGYRRSVRSYE